MQKNKIDKIIEAEAKKGQKALSENKALANGWYLGFKEGAEFMNHLKEDKG